MKSLAISAAAAALTLTGCGAEGAAFDPDTQWELVVHIEREGNPMGHVEVRTTQDLGSCTGTDCVYAIDVGTGPATLTPVEDDEDSTIFVGWSGDCDGQGPAQVQGLAGISLDCTGLFSNERNGTEFCDNQIDDDDSGELDCSDAACTDDPVCDLDQFGDFGDDDGLDYAKVGTTDCGWPDTLEPWSLTPGGIFFPVFGDDTDVFFEIVDGSTFQASASDVIVFEEAGHTCTLYESEYGDPVHVVWSFNCTSATGSCSQGYNAARP